MPPSKPIVTAQIKEFSVFELEGYANAPEPSLVLDLTEYSTDPYKTPPVVKTTYWLGNVGRSWQSIDATAVVAMKHIIEADGGKREYPYKNMSLWVLEDYGYLAPQNVPLFVFSLYDVENTFRPRQPHDGAYAKYVKAENGEVTMNNGWSSRPGIFNLTGIIPHVMDVRIRMARAEIAYSGFVVPVAGVEQLLHQYKFDETYQVVKSEAVNEIRYGLARKDAK